MELSLEALLDCEFVGRHRAERVQIAEVPYVRYKDRSMMTHKYRGSIVVLLISKSVEPNEEQKEMIRGFQQGILCKY